MFIPEQTTINPITKTITGKTDRFQQEIMKGEFFDDFIIKNLMIIYRDGFMMENSNFMLAG